MDSLALLQRWRETADEEAAADLFHRYVGRLVALARRQISPQLARRVDAEDVVQSACRSFFVRVRDGRLEVRPGSDLWDLLAAITTHKVFGQLARHTAGKRSLRREQELHDDDGSICLPVDALARDPTPEEVAIVTEEWRQAVKPLSPLHQRMVELRLEGYSQIEIAAQTLRSERMVRVVLSEFGTRLQERLSQLPND